MKQLIPELPGKRGKKFACQQHSRIAFIKALNKIFAFGLLTGSILFSGSYCNAQALTSKGKDFWMGFMENYTPASLRLYITSTVATTGTVSIPLGGWSVNYTVNANTTTLVNVPEATAHVLSSEVIEGKGVHIVSNDTVSVFALNYVSATSDAALILPTPTLGKEYYVMAYLGITGLTPSEFLVVAVNNNTTIEITPTALTNGNKPPGIPFNVTLNQGQVYQVQSTNGGDLTGTRVRSVPGAGNLCQKFAVFGGAQCTFVPPPCSFCDHLFEQMYPVNTWGKNYCAIPYKTRTDDTYRIVASQNATVVTFNGAAPVALNAGQFFEVQLLAPTIIDADKPIQVAQYSQGQTCDNANGDPFFIMLSSKEQISKNVTFNAFTSAIITNYYLNVLTKTSNVSTVTLDGVPVGGAFTSYTFAPTYSYAQLNITSGNHTLISDSGFVAYVYGYGSYESYGYAAAASVFNLSLGFTYTFTAGSACLGTGVNFSGNSNVAVTSWNWIFGDGGTASGQNVSHTYTASGTYTVQIIGDYGGGCNIDTVSQTVTIYPIPVPAPLNNSPLCTGSTLTLTSNSYSGATYSWTGPNSFSSSDQNPVIASVSASNAGTYSVSVSANGCSASGSTNVVVNPAPNVSASSVNPNCGVQDGQATATASAGTSPYTYSWSTTPVQTAQTATGLGAGAYTITVTDASGCTASALVTLSNIGSGTVSVSSVTNVSCAGGNNGSATAAMSGGSNPFTYSWNTSPSQNTATAGSLSAGNYIVSVTDGGGCVTIATVTITEPAAITASFSSTPASCGNADGTATVNASGGTGGFTFLWNPSSQITQTATGLAAGIYSVTVTDANNCVSTQTVTVSNLNSPAVFTAQANLQCNGQCTGYATATVTGGASPYTYAWSNLQTTNAASGLCAQTYTLLVTDNIGCSVAQTIIITEPAAITATVSATQATCGNSDGTATVSSSGGTGALTYLWNPSSQNTQTATGLAAGNYIVTVTDANACASTFSVTVNNANGPSVSFTQNNISCYGQCTGNATVNVTGGTLPYTFLWNPGGQTAPTANNLCADNYTVSVSDAGGCTFLQTINITQPATGMTAGASGGTTIMIGSSTQLSASGTGAISYNWTPTAGLSDPNIANPVATPTSTTDYCVTATDANGCTDSACVRVLVDEECGSVYVPNAFSPNGDLENDLECVVGNCISTMTFTIFNRWGEKVFETNDRKICWDGKFRGNLQNAGVYTYYLKGVTLQGETVNRKGNISLVR